LPSTRQASAMLGGMTRSGLFSSAHNMEAVKIRHEPTCRSLVCNTQSRMSPDIKMYNVLICGDLIVRLESGIAEI
jgi:hypothetical protein